MMNLKYQMFSIKFSYHIKENNNDSSWSFDDIRNNASSWSLEGDAKLLEMMQSISRVRNPKRNCMIFIMLTNNFSLEN